MIEKNHPVQYLSKNAKHPVCVKNKNVNLIGSPNLAAEGEMEWLGYPAEERISAKLYW